MTKPKKKKKLSALKWKGGKFSRLKWVLPCLDIPDVLHYCEPFGGSAAVLLNRPPTKVETYNDLYGEVVDFFKVLRDHTEELVESLRLTPYSRTELMEAVRPPVGLLSPVERARRFFVRARQSYGGRVQVISRGDWGYGTSGTIALGTQWTHRVEDLFAVADRLRRVQLENRPAMNILRRLDHPNMLIYCDPPYAFDTRRKENLFTYEMTNDEHVELAEQLHGMKARIAISGHRCDFTDGLYADWRRFDAKPRAYSLGNRSTEYEAMWMNYNEDGERL